MDNRGLPGNLTLVGIGGCLLLAITSASLVRAQSSTTVDWEKAAGGKMSFEVASIKPSAGPGAPIFSNFALGLGDQKPPNGILHAANLPLTSYIGFAYKLDQNQMLAIRAQVPQWVRTAWFDVEARPPATDLTRDQVRLMMQSLLTDRFKLAVHFESKEGPVYALAFAKPGKLGPQMRSYPDGFPCSATPPAGGGRGGGPAPTVPTVDNGRFPASCGQISPMTPSTPGLVRQGGRNIPLGSIVGLLQMSGGLDRPLIDRTGLSGTFDVSVEFEVPLPPDIDVPAGSRGTPFLEAVRDQLGLRLESTSAMIDTVVIDHIEPPSPN